MSGMRMEGRPGWMLRSCWKAASSATSMALRSSSKEASSRSRIHSFQRSSGIWLATNRRLSGVVHLQMLKISSQTKIRFYRELKI